MHRSGGLARSAQDVAFCRAADGTRIAYARHGSGPPLVIATCWLSHLHFDWDSPVWRHFLADIGEFATIIRYDERGHGLSDRDTEEFGLEARISDLEAVIEHAGLDRFALMAMAQGGPVAIEYAVRHPERVTRLMFYDSYAAAVRSDDPEARELSEAFEAMIKVGWARPDSAFRRVFTSMMIPNATEEQMTWLDELQRVCATAEVAYHARRERNTVDVTHQLQRVTAPALVLHSIGDRMNDFEEGRIIASGIPDARLVPLESDNHILLADEPAWPIFLREVRAFLEPDRQDSDPSPATLPPLSPRELDVLHLVARGLDNDEIARDLSISARTVERHLQNTYVKLDVRGKSARAAAVARLLSG